MAMKVIIGADPLGFRHQGRRKKYLLSSGYEVEDITGDGPIDYYNVGYNVGKRISSGEFERGLYSAVPAWA